MPKVQMPHVIDYAPQARWKRGKLLDVKDSEVQTLLDQGGVLVTEIGVKAPVEEEPEVTPPEPPRARVTKKRARVKK